MKSDYSLGRRERLRRYSVFQTIKRDGRSSRGARLAINTLPNRLPYNRIGISISARVVPRSATRHRLKRLITESYRLNKKNFKTGFDIIIRISSNRKDASLDDIKEDLLAVFKKAGLIK